MTDNISLVTPSPASTPAPAAVVEAPVAVAPAPIPVVAPAPAQAPEAAVAHAPAQAPAPVEAPKTTVLGEALSADPNPPPLANPEGQSADTAPPPSAEEVKVEEAKPAPTFESFTLPEGVTFQDERLKEFTGLLSGLELEGKADHKAVQEFGQKAVDFHIAELKRVTEDYNKLLQTSWEKTKTDWKEAFLADPEIGGNKWQTNVDSALSFIRTHGGTAEQQSEFKNLMETSGLGNHPAMIRMLANAGRAMSEGKPLAAMKPVSAPRSKTETLYGRTST